jgi:acyl-CoA synthetase (AMP-forming)/AMP-acid ligase II
MTYVDALHIYGVYRADYIPQLFSIRLPSPEVIFELLAKANAKALIYDSNFEHLMNNSPTPTYLASKTQFVDFTSGHLPDMSVAAMDDTAFIFHTSGSTAGTPKLVPWTNLWIGRFLDKALYLFPASTETQTVAAWMGSMCHAGQSGCMRNIV